MLFVTYIYLPGREPVSHSVWLDPESGAPHPAGSVSVLNRIKFSSMWELSLARFHLSLASKEDTVYRAVAMYLCAQYFVRAQGQDADLGLQGLKTIYQELQRVNRVFSARLRAASDKDVALNALVILDMFAKSVPYTINDSLLELKGLFSA